MPGATNLTPITVNVIIIPLQILKPVLILILVFSIFNTFNKTSIQNIYEEIETFKT